MVLSASYTDKGGNNIKALTGNSVVSLQGNVKSFNGNEKKQGFTPYKYGGNNILLFPAGDGWFEMNQIDLAGVHSVNLNSGWQTPPATGFSFEIKLDAPDGKSIGKGTMPAPQKNQKFGSLKIPVQSVADGKLHDLYFIYKVKDVLTGAGVLSIQFNP